MTVKGAPAGSAPVIATAGADANIDLKLTPKGTGNTLITSGNVGIGTTSPQTLFELSSPLNAAVDLSKTGAGAGTAQIYNDGNLNLVSSSGIDIIRYRSSTHLFSDRNTANEWMRIDSTGNVGIGTSSPGAALHVSVGGSTAPNQVTGLYVDNDGNADTYFALQTHTLAGYGLSVTNAGTVGIGTTAPKGLLDVEGGKILASTTDSVFGQVQVANPTASGEASIGFVSGANGYGDSISSSSGPTNIWAIGAGVWNIGGDSFGIGDRNYGSAIMTIQAGGNVGIGTTAPTSTLVVNGASRNAAAVLNASSTVDFSTGNLQYTMSSCGAFSLNNVKDGGSYTLAIKGTTSATCSFTAYSDAGVTALTVHMPPGNDATSAGTHTLYTFLAIGTDLYASWIPGL